MSFNKLSKESSLTSKSKTESILYNTNDYLNPNANTKDEKEDLFKLLGQGPLQSQIKRNSLLSENFNFNANEANNKILKLNVAEYQKKINLYENEGIIDEDHYNNKVNCGLENVSEHDKKLFKKAEDLNRIIKEKNDKSFSSARSDFSSQKGIDNNSFSNKSSSSNRNKNNASAADNNKNTISKKTISEKTFSDKSNNSKNNNSKSTKKIEAAAAAAKNEENENLISEDNINLNENLTNNNSSNNNNNYIISITNNNNDINIQASKRNSKNPKFKNIQNNILGLETGEINSKTLCVPTGPGSPQKLLSPDYNRNNEEIKEEINDLLNFREMEKLKLSKRRKSINLRRKSENDKKRNLEMNSAAIVNMLNKENQISPQEKFKKYIKYIDILIAITVLFNVAISIIDNEIYISKSDSYLKEYTQKNNITSIDLETLSKIADRPISSEENGLRFINILVVFSNLFFIYVHYHLKVKVLQQDHKLSEYENIFTSGYYKHCLFEMLICGIFYPPYANSVLSGQVLNLIYVYNLNALISFIVMLKCYIILRVYSYFSRWTSESANSVCTKNNVRGGIHFAVKAELKKRTYTMLTIMMLVSLTILSFALRTFEYGVKDPSNTTSLKGDGNDLQSLLNCFWLIIVTMTTVGYGDYFPKSHLGRFIGVVACIIGMLIVSLIVVSLAVIAEFTGEEKKAYSLLKKLQADDNAYKKAIKVMIGVLKLRKLVVKSKQQGKKGNSLSERFILLTTLKKEISSFKNDYKIANSYSLPIDEMLKRLESKLKGDIQQLTANIKKLSSVEGELDKISKQQDSIRSKIETITMRQEKIAKYIVKVNNDNYKRFVLESLKEKVKEENEEEDEENFEEEEQEIDVYEGIKENSVESSLIDSERTENKEDEEVVKRDNNNESENYKSGNQKNKKENFNVNDDSEIKSVENQKDFSEEKNGDSGNDLGVISKSKLNSSSMYSKFKEEEDGKLFGQKISTSRREDDDIQEDINFKKSNEDAKKNYEERISIGNIDEKRSSQLNDFLIKMDDINNMIKINNYSSLSDNAVKNSSFLKKDSKKNNSGKELVNSGLDFYNENLKAGNDYNLEKVYFGKTDKDHNI